MSFGILWDVMPATAANGLLERELEERYGCRSIPVERKIVKAVIGDKPVILSVTKFELIGHECAQYCYAWSGPTKHGIDKIMSILMGAPILTAEDAVWARLNYEEETR